MLLLGRSGVRGGGGGGGIESLSFERGKVMVQKDKECTSKTLVCTLNLATKQEKKKPSCQIQYTYYRAVHMIVEQKAPKCSIFLSNILSIITE